jgi:hypothetical protein
LGYSSQLNGHHAVSESFFLFPVLVIKGL